MGEGDFLNLLVYSDSLGFPRPGDSADVGLTYPFRLRNLIESRLGIRTNLLLRGGGGAKSTDIRRLAERDAGYFVGEGARASICVLQFGVVDCAPRPGTYRFVPILRLLPAAGPSILAGLARQRARIQSLWSYTFTSPKRFESEYRRTLRAWHEVSYATISVGMPLPPVALEARSPGFRANVRKYNELIRRVSGVSFCDIEAEIDEAVRASVLLADGHHLSATGHALFAERLFESVRGVL